MKKIIKKILIILIKNEVVWFFAKRLVWLGQKISALKNYNYDWLKINNDLKNNLFEDLTVRNGPFKGMIYPEINSAGSTIYPKLLGCYEKELWDIIEDFKKNKYTEIIDVGCAEGYYAVGLGINIPEATIYAYDISKKARLLCRHMSILNKIKERVIVKKICTAETLKEFTFTGKGLVVCDCEGYEKKIFNKDNVKNLTKCDLLIETHDLFDIGISTYIKEVFRETHNILSIKSIDDIEKTLTYNFSELENFSLENKKFILAENRPAIIEWLIITPKF